MVRPCGFPGTAFFISLARGRGLGREGGSDLGGLSFYSCPYLLLSPQTGDWGQRTDGDGQPSEMGAGLHGFYPGSLFGGGFLPRFLLHIKSLSS